MVGMSWTGPRKKVQRAWPVPLTRPPAIKERSLDCGSHSKGVTTARVLVSRGGVEPRSMAFRRSCLHPRVMEDLKKRLGDWFRTARLRMGLTQEALAEQVGVTTETISNSERGESLVTLPVFLSLAEALELDLAEIVEAKPSTLTKTKLKRLKLEGELRQLGADMNDTELELLIGIGRLVRAKRG